MVGGSVSVTVTVKLQVEPSVAEQLTVVVPFGKADPDDGVQVKASGLPHSSAPIGGGKFTTSEQPPGSVPLMILAGQLMR
jgi:hypothetical protein